MYGGSARDVKRFSDDFGIIPGFSSLKPRIFDGRGSVGIYSVIVKAFGSAFRSKVKLVDFEAIADYENVVHFIPDEERMNERDQQYFSTNLRQGTPFSRITLERREVFKRLQLDDDKVPFRVIQFGRFVGDDYGGNMTAHANLLLVDVRNETVEYFEPHGANSGHDHILSQLEAIFSTINFDVVSPSLACPMNIGPQAKLGDLDQGWCSLWSGFYLVYRMLHPELYPATVAKRMTAGTREEVYDRFLRFQSLIVKADELNGKQIGGALRDVISDTNCLSCL